MKLFWHIQSCLQTDYTTDLWPPGGGGWWAWCWCWPDTGTPHHRQDWRYWSPAARSCPLATPSRPASGRSWRRGRRQSRRTCRPAWARTPGGGGTAQWGNTAGRPCRPPPQSHAGTRPGTPVCPRPPGGLGTPAAGGAGQTGGAGQGDLSHLSRCSLRGEWGHMLPSVTH